jgi:membrane fusion protein, multidrug efflux system
MSSRADEKGDQRPSKDRTWGYIQLALVILLIGGAFLFSRYLASRQTPPDPGPTDRERTLVVETIVISPQAHRLQFSATGTVQTRAVTGIVPQVSGRVVYIDENAFPGGVFTPETILFRIEEEDYRNALDRMQAEVARAQTQLQLQQAASEAAIEEWRELNPGIPAPPLVAETPQLEEAQANLRAAQAGLRAARLDLARTTYRLPFTGRMINIQLEQGQYAVAGQSYGQAYRLASLEIEVPLPERHLKWLLEADEPQMRVSSDDMNARMYTAFMKRISAHVDAQTRFARVILGLHETTPDLVPDVFVSVNFVGPERRNVWLLPLEALQAENLIWVIGPENRLQSLRPPIIQITDIHAVAESDGTSIRVVRGSLPQATDGVQVRLSDDEVR